MAANPAQQYDLVVVSDWHMMTKRPIASEWKRRFLDTVKAHTIVANGDMIDGQRINLHAPKEMTEQEKRILDSFNMRAANGTSVIWLPGNHDEELRRMDIFGPVSAGLPPGLSASLPPPPPELSAEWRIAFKDIRFEPELDYYTGDGGKKHIEHGDRFDPEEWHIYDVAEKWTPKKLRFWDSAYAKVMGVCSEIGMKTGFNPLAVFMRTKENYKKTPQRFAGRVVADAHAKGYDGSVTGHTHLPRLEEYRMPDGRIITCDNAGDGVENLTALGFKKDGTRELISLRDWMKALGPETGNRAAFNKAAVRETRTEPQVEVIHKVWPGKIKTDWKKILHLAA